MGNDSGAAPGLDAAPDAGRDRVGADLGVADANGDERTSADSADADAEASADAAAEVDSGCPPFARPAAVPPDWEEYTDWSCGCRFWIPGAKGQMPPPIQWEPCPPPAPQNVVCERMKPFWTSAGMPMTVWPRFSLDVKTNAPLIEFARLHYNDDVNVRYKLVAEADGKVRTAFLQANPANKGCEIGLDKMADNRFTFNVVGNSWSGPLDGTYEGVIAGDIDDPHPPVMAKFKHDPSSEWGWAASSGWLVQIRETIVAHSWDHKSSFEVYSPGKDPEGFSPHNLNAVGQAVFWQVDVMGYSGVMSWDQAHGARPLLRWYGDWSRGAGNFRTDGRDMVWTYGEGKAPQDKYTNNYAALSVMTAPHTTDPTAAQATARRLRSDLSAFGIYPWGIGCGYAARAEGMIDATGERIAILVVRLSDGASWIVKSAPQPDQHGFLPAFVLGTSCEHVYAAGETYGSPYPLSTIFRIRLDSLGPPLPPD
jgi:hypothetical protein